jgi:hypothetical protein
MSESMPNTSTHNANPEQVPEDLAKGPPDSTNDEAKRPGSPSEGAEREGDPILNSDRESIRGNGLPPQPTR